MKLTKIYTRGGDEGQTSLGDGRRISKTHARIRAIGAIDDVNAAIGVTQAGSPNMVLAKVQQELFDLGADICVPEEGESKKEALRMTAEEVGALETEIDRNKL